MYRYFLCIKAHLEYMWIYNLTHKRLSKNRIQSIPFFNQIDLVPNSVKFGYISTTNGQYRSKIKLYLLCSDVILQCQKTPLPFVSQEP